MEHLKNIETFDSDSIFSDDVLNAAAFAKLFDKKAFSDSKSEIALFNRKTKEKKAGVNEWSALIRDKASEISSRKNDLMTRHNEILAQIQSLSVVANNDDLQNFAIPSGYSVSINGVEKVAGESMITAAIAPILLKILGERNFLFYICAPTRAGKTTALYLAASAVGDEKIIRSFDATKNGLAGAAADVSEFAFLVDEKQVADSGLKEQLDTPVYALANGVGRTKLNKDSTLRKFHDRRASTLTRQCD